MERTTRRRPKSAESCPLARGSRPPRPTVRAARAPCRRSGTRPARRAGSPDASGTSRRLPMMRAQQRRAPSAVVLRQRARGSDRGPYRDGRDHGERDRVSSVSSWLLAAQSRYDRAALEIAVPRARIDERLQSLSYALQLLDLVLDVLEPFLGAPLDATNVAIRG